ncbi:MAG: Txe/YoeB family addiction module toxin [Flavobacteriaceae bacterium]|nr:Txe/YoeB family addiction module toxin [Flavobacteriaceae bacterium]
MEIVFLPDAKRDLDFWVKTGNKSIVKKITLLIASIRESSFEGIGKPEPLKHSLSGCWSRRINKEHRLVYEVLDNKILIHSAKGHYA